MSYYPFGLTFNSYTRENSVDQKYLYNGKEIQRELNLGWLDYGARMYQPEIGRWGAVDVMAQAYYSSSPYQYVLNNPVINIDVKGQWTVSRHYSLTYAALSAAGIGKKQADVLSHYASVYADHPPNGVVWLNNTFHPTNQSYYRYSSIDYSGTKNSQITDYEGVGENYNVWHSMRSNWEKDQWDKGLGGISATGAMIRGMGFGWSKIFESAKGGKLGSLKKNSAAIQAFGQGIHALQDGYAHEGTTIKEHSAHNDRYGDTATSEKISNSAVMVHSIMSGDVDTYSNMLEAGNNSLDLKGISGENLLQLNDKVKALGANLVYNWDTNTYDIKK